MKATNGQYLIDSREQVPSRNNGQETLTEPNPQLPIQMAMEHYDDKAQMANLLNYGDRWSK
jgi:hypothetical protein